MADSLGCLAVGAAAGLLTAAVARGSSWIEPAYEAGAAPAVEPQWIWVATPTGVRPTVKDAAVGEVWVGCTFEVPGEVGVVAARLVVAADNSAVAYLNGEEVVRSESWSRPAVAKVEVRPGTNVLAVHARNEAGGELNPAGVLVVLEVTLADGVTIRVVSDEEWWGAMEPWKGWPRARGGEMEAGSPTLPQPPAAGGGSEAAEKLNPVVVLGPATAAPWRVDLRWLEPGRPCPVFRRSFELEGSVTRARVRIVGLGHYELRLNGHRVGDTLINQTWSQYDATIYEDEYDITGLLRPGANVFGVLLGNSFWSVGPTNDSGRFSKTDAEPDFSDGHVFLLRLSAEIERADGRLDTIATDAEWRWTDGPLTFSHIYGGEDFDPRREQAGWDEPGFDDSDWQAAQVAPAPAGSVERTDAPGIKTFEVFQPTEVREPAPGVYTYIFPQNCSALLRYTVEGPAGATVRFKPCEYMDESGRVHFTYTWGTGKDIWFDYTLRGGGPESHQTLFCYVGAQFVEVTGAVPEGRPNPAGLPVVKRLEMVHVRAANAPAGTFMCSSELQNAAHRIIDWAIRSNMSHVATDCPHREKCGWQEQNWHMARALSYGYDIRDWYRKIAGDIRDTQLPDGHIPTNCPNYLVGVPPHGFWNEAPEWGVAGVLVPWHLYEWYGDRAALEVNFESMARFVDYLASQAEDGVIRSNLGDWYDYGHGQGDGPSRWTPTEVSATAIWAIAASTTAQAAEVLGRTDDAARYRAMHGQIRRDFQRRFYDPATQTVSNRGSCQAANAVATCAGLLPEADCDGALDAIVADLERRGWQQTTGEVLQVFLIRALAEQGRGDVLHRIYAREAQGSYGYMVRQGLTTLPESWSANPGTVNSMNHFMLGHLVEWHYAYVGGIRQQTGSVGWKRILFAPQPGPLDSTSVTFDSPAGAISSRWISRDGVFELTATIPPHVEAEAILPDGTQHDLPSGVETTVRCAWP